MELAERCPCLWASESPGGAPGGCTEETDMEQTVYQTPQKDVVMGRPDRPATPKQLNIIGRMAEILFGIPDFIVKAEIRDKLSSWRASLVIQAFQQRRIRSLEQLYALAEETQTIPAA